MQWLQKGISSLRFGGRIRSSQKPRNPSRFRQLARCALRASELPRKLGAHRALQGAGLAFGRFSKNDSGSETAFTRPFDCAIYLLKPSATAVARALCHPGLKLVLDADENHHRDGTAQKKSVICDELITVRRKKSVICDELILGTRKKSLIAMNLFWGHEKNH